MRRPAALGVVTLVATPLFVSSVSSRAAAGPQASLGLTLGGAVEDDAGRARGAFSMGGRADVLFLRGRGDQMAIGPYADAATASFRDFDAGGGLEWLVPVRDDLPLVLSAGAFFRDGEGRAWAPGAEGTVFFGSRSYNFHSWYGLAAGLFAQARWVPASSSAPYSADFVFGVQIDAEILAMPSMLIISALRN